MPERREEREEGKKEINNIGRARRGLEDNLSRERGKHNDRERNKRETTVCFTDLTHKDAHIMTTKITLLLFWRALHLHILHMGLCGFCLSVISVSVQHSASK